MKTFLLSSLCLLMVTACIQQPQPVEPTIVYAQPAPAAPVAEEAPAVRENPYALNKVPAYDDSKFVYEEKERQLFRMESDLLNAQQELYDRERQLAYREAEFLSKSKSLYQKEKMLDERAESLARAVPEKRYAPEPKPIVVSAPALRPLPEKKVNPYRYQSRPADGMKDYNTSPSVIILEHPIQRDLVRCAVSDDTCLHSYERLGYIRSNDLSDYSTPDEPFTSEQGNPDLAWW